MISSTFASFLSSELYSSSLCFSSASSSSYPSLFSHFCFLLCLSFSSSSCLNHRFFSFPFSWRFHNLLINFSEILIKTMRSKSMDFSKTCIYISVWLAFSRSRRGVCQRHSLFVDLTQVGAGSSHFDPTLPDGYIFLFPPNLASLVSFLFFLVVCFSFSYSSHKPLMIFS